MTTIRVRLFADPGNTKQTTAEVEQSFDKMGSAVTGIFAGLGAQLGSVFGSIGEQLSSALDVGKSQDKLAAQLGLTADEAAKFGKVAGDLYKGAWGESLDEVNDTIAKITRNIGEGNDQWLKETGALTLDFANTFEQDTTRITAAIGTMLNTGVAQSSEEAFDILTKGMQSGADKGEDLLDTFIEYPTLFRELGLNGQTAMGLINQALEAGARNSDVVADGLKEFSIRAKDGSKATAEGFAAIGLSAEAMGAMVAQGGDASFNALDATLKALRAMEDPVKRDAAAVQLFGTKAEDLGDALFAMDPDNAADALGTVTGAAQQMSDTLNDNAATTLESYKRQALMGIADVLVNHVIPAFFQIKDAILAVGEWFAQNKELAIALGIGIGVSLLPVLIGLAASLWSSVVAAVALAAPFIAVAAVVAGLTAAVIWAYENWGWFRTAVDAVAHVVKDVLWPALQSIVGWIAANFVPGVQAIAGIFVTVGGKVWDFVVGVKDAFADVISFIWGLPGRIEQAAQGMWNGITNAFRSAINWIIAGWNGLEFRVPGFKIGPVGYDGFTLGVPDIPYLDTGGIIRRDTLAMVHKNEAVVPLPADWKRNGLGGATTVINVYALKPDRRVGRDIDRALVMSRSSGAAARRRS